MSILNLISLLGIAGLIFIAWLLSADRRNFNWRVVLWGTGLQMLFAVFIFVLPIGSKFFMILNDIVLKLINSALEGSKFVFGPLALPPGTSEKGVESIGYILAFQSFPTVVFFAALLAVLYYYNIIPRLIEWFSYIFTKWMKISGAESLCVSSNVFVGIESALTIKPYINNMTRSELCTILAAMMGTIASSVMALYVMILQPIFSNIAGHLISATIMSAPAAVVMSKIILPESEKPETLGLKVKAYYEKDSSLIEAVINGSMTGGRMVFGIVVLLLSVIGLAALLNQIMALLGGGVNDLLGLKIDFTLQGLLGYVFYPLTFLLGINPHDISEISRIIGERTVLTEIQSYKDLAELMRTGELVDSRSAILASYALCGFAHIASMGIFMGGLAAVAPKRIKDFAEVSVRALIAATLGCQMTACVAGVFLTKGSILLG